MMRGGDSTLSAPVHQPTSAVQAGLLAPGGHLAPISSARGLAAHHKPPEAASRRVSLSSSASLPSPIPSPLSDAEHGFTQPEALAARQTRTVGAGLSLPLSPPQLSPPASRAPGAEGLPPAPPGAFVPLNSQAQVSAPPAPEPSSTFGWSDLLVDPDLDHDEDMAQVATHHALDPVDPDHDMDESSLSHFDVTHWERLKDDPDFTAHHGTAHHLDAFPDFVADHEEGDANTVVSSFFNRLGDIEMADWTTGSTVANSNVAEHAIPSAPVSKVRTSDSTVFTNESFESMPWFADLDSAGNLGLDAGVFNGHRRSSESTEGTPETNLPLSTADSGNILGAGMSSVSSVRDRRSSLASLGGLLEHTKISSSPSPPSQPASSDFTPEMTVDQALADIARQFLAPNQGQASGQRQGALVNMFDAAVGRQERQAQPPFNLPVAPARRPSAPNAFASPGLAAVAAAHKLGDPGSPSPSVVSSSTNNTASSSGSSGHQRPPYIKAMPSTVPRKAPGSSPGNVNLGPLPGSAPPAVAAAGRLKATMDSLERERNAMDTALAAKATMEEEIRRSALLVAAHHKRVGGQNAAADPNISKRKIKRAATEPTDFGQAAIRAAGGPAYNRRPSISAAPPLMASSPLAGTPLFGGSVSVPARPVPVSSQSTPEQWQSALQSLITSRGAARPASNVRNTVHVPPPHHRSRSKTIDSAIGVRDLNMIQQQQQQQRFNYDRQLQQQQHVLDAIAAGGIAPGLANANAPAATATRNRRRSSVMVGEIQWRSARAQSPDVSSVASSPGPSRPSWIQLANSPAPSSTMSTNELGNRSLSPYVQGASDMLSNMAMSDSATEPQPRRRRRESLSVTELFRRHQLECDECRNRALMGGPTTGEMHIEGDGSISSILGAHAMFHGHGFQQRFGRRRAMSGPGPRPSFGNGSGYGIGQPSPPGAGYPGFQADQASQIVEGLLPLGASASMRSRAGSDASSYVPSLDTPLGPSGSQFDMLVANSTPSPSASDMAVGSGNVGAPQGLRPDWRKHRRPSSLGMDFAGMDDGNAKPSMTMPEVTQSQPASKSDFDIGLDFGLSQMPQQNQTGSLFQVG